MDDSTPQTGGAESDSGTPLLDRRHFVATFSSETYLHSFYSNVEEPAMYLVLTFLPKIVARLEERIKGGKYAAMDLRWTLLDFGAGPTIHVAVCFRNLAREIYLADFLSQNRDELSLWLMGRSGFHWTPTLQIIAIQEGFPSLPTSPCRAKACQNPIAHLAEMEREAKSRVSGILSCDALNDPPLNGLNHDDSGGSGEIPSTYDIVTSFFTLEYCCLSLVEYKRAIERVAALVKPNGYFILGGCLEESWCAFGGHRYRLLPVTREYVLKCLAEAGMDVGERGGGEQGAGKDVGVQGKSDGNEENGGNGSGGTAIIYEVNGIMLVCCRKTCDDQMNGS